MKMNQTFNGMIPQVRIIEVPPETQDKGVYISKAVHDIMSRLDMDKCDKSSVKLYPISELIWALGFNGRP